MIVPIPPGGLIPAELAPDLVESHVARHSARSQAVYCSIVFIIVAGIAALPLTDVDVSVQAPGIVRPSMEKHDVRTASGGTAERLLVRENQRVARGQPLLLLAQGPSATRSGLLAARSAAARDAVHDLALLTSRRVELPSGAGLRLPRYREEHARLLSVLREGELRQEEARRRLDRVRALLERQFATPAEVEAERLRLATADAELATIRDRQVAEWHAALGAERASVIALRAESEQLSADRRQLVVRAPVRGTVEQLAPLAAGSFVGSGDVVAVISPDLPPIAEVHVSPRDVGFLRPGASVRFQVDAFNYTDWGMATGRVAEISDDYVLVDDRPMFKVRCTLDVTELRLRNGRRGRIRKGMTFRARFPVARRSVLQLLRDDVNGWLGPTQTRS